MVGFSQRCSRSSVRSGCSSSGWCRSGTCSPGTRGDSGSRRELRGSQDPCWRWSCLSWKTRCSRCAVAGWAQGPGGGRPGFAAAADAMRLKGSSCREVVLGGRPAADGWGPRECRVGSRRWGCERESRERSGRPAGC